LISSVSNKNLQASAYTTLVLILLGLLFFFVSWAPPAATPLPKNLLQAAEDGGVFRRMHPKHLPMI